MFCLLSGTLLIFNNQGNPTKETAERLPAFQLQPFPKEFNRNQVCAEGLGESQGGAIFAPRSVDLRNCDNIRVCYTAISNYIGEELYR